MNNSPLLWDPRQYPILGSQSELWPFISSWLFVSLPHRLQPSSLSQIEPLNPLLWFPNIPHTGSLFSALPQQVLTELSSASSPLLFCPPRFPPSFLALACCTCLVFVLLPTFHRPFSGAVCSSRQLSFGDKWLLPNAWSQFILFPHGVTFADGTLTSRSVSTSRVNNEDHKNNGYCHLLSCITGQGLY